MLRNSAALAVATVFTLAIIGAGATPIIRAGSLNLTPEQLFSRGLIHGQAIHRRALADPDAKEYGHVLMARSGPISGLHGLESRDMRIRFATNKLEARANNGSPTDNASPGPTAPKSQLGSRSNNSSLGKQVHTGKANSDTFISSQTVLASQWQTGQGGGQITYYSEHGPTPYNQFGGGKYVVGVGPSMLGGGNSAVGGIIIKAPSAMPMPQETYNAIAKTASSSSPKKKSVTPKKSSAPRRPPVPRKHSGPRRWRRSAR